MRIRNSNTYMELEPELVLALSILRKKRNFNSSFYLSNKTKLINEYMKKHKLDTCVLGLSGGIDSAVTLGILIRAKKTPSSPIKKIIAVTLPIFDKGATNQKKSVLFAEKIARKFNSPLITIDLTPAHRVLKQKIDRKLRIKGKNWASGQLISYIRTPALYYITSLLSQSGRKAIICGTTNRDEGSYLGFFGKASDGMVDLQIISDIHKSEVYKLADSLGVPKEILKRAPSGDLFDGKTDEEVFGTTYDFVELFLLLSALNKKSKEKEVKKWTSKAKKQYKVLEKRLEALHSYNLHKYLGQSPSVHLDIYERLFPGGWTK